MFPQFLLSQSNFTPRFDREPEISMTVFNRPWIFSSVLFFSFSVFGFGAVSGCSASADSGSEETPNSSPTDPTKPGATADATANAMPDGPYVQPAAPRDAGATDTAVDAAPQKPLLETDFTAIVKLNGCSGSVVRFKTSRSTDFAMVLTNGHCNQSGLIPPGKAISNKPSNVEFQVNTVDGKGYRGKLTASELIYGTMTGTDMILYKLTSTFAEISAQYEFDALTLSDKIGFVGEPIRIVSGYWRRIYACKIDGLVDLLREGKWSNMESIRFTQPGCDTIGGTSGSPIIDPNTREVVGVNTTGNEDGESCTDNNPCEVKPDGGIVVTKGAAYGDQVYWVYSCLASDNSLDFSLPGCRLTKP
jgi:hypothetical protein